jgi:4'-phosphopantetheinyl transferase
MHLWCLALTQIPLTLMLTKLSDAERQRAELFGRRQDFESFVKTRGALRSIIAAGTGRRARSLELVEGQGRKPRLCDNSQGLHFSVSHSADYALIGVGWRALGVDIECVRGDINWQSIAGTSFHPRERAALAAPSTSVPTEAFFQIWTQKEAYLKGTGRGVALDLASFATEPDGGPVSDRGEASAVPWFTLPLAAPAGYKAALAVPLRQADAGDVTPRLADFADWP